MAVLKNTAQNGAYMAHNQAYREKVRNSAEQKKLDVWAW
jgi:hypothetical protein